MLFVGPFLSHWMRCSCPIRKYGVSPTSFLSFPRFGISLLFGNRCAMCRLFLGIGPTRAQFQSLIRSPWHRTYANCLGYRASVLFMLLSFFARLTARTARFFARISAIRLSPVRLSGGFLFLLVILIPVIRLWPQTYAGARILLRPFYYIASHLEFFAN